MRNSGKFRVDFAEMKIQKNTVMNIPLENFVYWAAGRGRECNLTEKYIAQLYVNQKGLCAISGLPLDESVMSLDRKNSNKDYIKGNVQWVHVMVNRMKSNFAEKDFIKMCVVISKYKNKKYAIQK